MRGEVLTYACQEKNEIRHTPTHQKRDTNRNHLRIPIFIKFSNTKGIYIMKTKNVICAMAILIVILTVVIVLCAFTSPEEAGVLIVVSEYYADEAQQNIPEAENNDVKVHLDGSQKPPFSE